MSDGKSKRKTLGPVKLSHDDSVRLVKDWNIQAILTLFELENFEVSVSAISLRLNISEAEVSRCIETLIALGLIEKQENGSYLCADNILFTEESNLDPDFILGVFKNTILSAESRVKRNDAYIQHFAMLSPSIIKKYLFDINDIVLKMAKESSSLEDQEVHLFMSAFINAASVPNSNHQRASSSSVQKFAHDIRSPLSALNAVASRFHDLPSDIRDILAATTDRINSIANDILEEKKTMEGNSVSSLIATRFDLSLAIDRLIKEKASIFPEFKIIYKGESNPLYISVSKKSLLRVLSNLLNNSIEASVDKKDIYISAYKKGSKVVVSVVDMGIGMSEVTLSQVRLVGYTTKGGNGMGVRSAYEFAEVYGGEIKIRSQLGVGTQVELIFEE